MSTAEKIGEKEKEIKALEDKRWFWLLKQRRSFLSREKEQCIAASRATKQEAKDSISAAIDEGYLRFLKSIIKASTSK